MLIVCPAGKLRQGSCGLLKADRPSRRRMTAELQGLKTRLGLFSESNWPNIRFDIRPILIRF
jgi:hypothetical protein